jgi:hypothetical protein
MRRMLLSSHQAVQKSKAPVSRSMETIKSIASKLAPTKNRRKAFAPHHSRPSVSSLQLLILTHRPLERPSAGSAQWATRQGCRVSRPRPWMADGGGPTEQDRSEGMPSHSEAPNERGKRALVTLALFQSDPL